MLGKLILICVAVLGTLSSTDVDPVLSPLVSKLHIFLHNILERTEDKNLT